MADGPKSTTTRPEADGPIDLLGTVEIKLVLIIVLLVIICIASLLLCCRRQRMKRKAELQKHKSSESEPRPTHRFATSQEIDEELRAQIPELAHNPLQMRIALGSRSGESITLQKPPLGDGMSVSTVANMYKLRALESYQQSNDANSEFVPGSLPTSQSYPNTDPRAGHHALNTYSIGQFPPPIGQIPENELTNMHPHSMGNPYTHSILGAHTTHAQSMGNPYANSILGSGTDAFPTYPNSMGNPGNPYSDSIIGSGTHAFPTRIRPQSLGNANADANSMIGTVTDSGRNPHATHNMNNADANSMIGSVTDSGGRMQPHSTYTHHTNPNPAMNNNADASSVRGSIINSDRTRPHPMYNHSKPRPPHYPMRNADAHSMIGSVTDNGNGPTITSRAYHPNPHSIHNAMPGDDAHSMAGTVTDKGTTAIHHSNANSIVIHVSDDDDSDIGTEWGDESVVEGTGKGTHRHQNTNLGVEGGYLKGKQVADASSARNVFKLQKQGTEHSDAGSNAGSKLDVLHEMNDKTKGLIRPDSMQITSEGPEPDTDDQKYNSGNPMYNNHNVQFTKSQTVVRHPHANPNPHTRPLPTRGVSTKPAVPARPLPMRYGAMGGANVNIRQYSEIDRIQQHAKQTRNQYGDNGGIYANDGGDVIVSMAKTKQNPKRMNNGNTWK